MNRQAAVWVMAVAALVASALSGCAADPQVIQSGAIGASTQVGQVLLRSVHVAAPPAPSYPAGADAVVWLTLINESGSPDTLAEVSSPAADRVEIRWDRECDGGYDPVPTLPLPPRDPAVTEPPAGAAPFDAYHLRLVDLTQPILSGTSLDLAFRFAHAGEVRVEVTVQPYDAPHPEPSTRCR